VRTKDQTTRGQLVVEASGARRELGALDRELQVTQPHLQQVFIRKLEPRT
jgi:hypothetical protein